MNDSNHITPQQAAGALLLCIGSARRALRLVGPKCNGHVLCEYVRDAVQSVLDSGQVVSIRNIAEELKRHGTPECNRWSFVFGDGGKWTYQVMHDVPQWLIYECNKTEDIE